MIKHCFTIFFRQEVYIVNWYVLFVQTLHEDTLCSFFNRDKQVFAFSVKIEYYRKDRKRNELKSLFPGYVFIKTELNQKEFNDWLRQQEQKKGFIKQLQYKEENALTPEEIQLFNMLLDDNGILRMSYGNIVDSKLLIKKGPLANFDSYIIKYDKRNRIATMDLFFLNKRWIAGVTLLDCVENKEI